MKLCATVAEFNPFHNGHKYLVDNFKDKYDGTIAIMSGNFVQRGAPSIYNKFSRAHAAVEGGVDLVIELPLIYALSSAETFALGAIKTLNATNCIDTLFFGSEKGEIYPLRAAAEISANETDVFRETLKEKLSAGLSYPKALGESYHLVGIEDDVISSPNNILGIEYIKALIKTNSPIKPATLKRFGASHDSSVTSQSIASASHVRALIESGNLANDYIPQFSYSSPVFDRHFSDIILYAVKSATYDDFLSIPDCSESLASRFVSASAETTTEAVISSVKSKNFTESRIRRILWNLVLKNSISPLTDPTYIRVLAQNKRGSQIISCMKERSSLPVIQKCARLKDDEIFRVEARATDIYNIPLNLPSGEEYRYSPVPIL